jgi:hypothetical protein
VVAHVSEAVAPFALSVEAEQENRSHHEKNQKL